MNALFISSGVLTVIVLDRLTERAERALAGVTQLAEGQCFFPSIPEAKSEMATDLSISQTQAAAPEADEVEVRLMTLIAKEIDCSSQGCISLMKSLANCI